MDLYAEKYLAAYDLGKDDQHEECAKVAMQALIDLPGTPRYWQIKNCTLIAWALDDWYDAEDFRSLGEEIYDMISEEWTDSVADDEGLTAEGIVEVRKDLDMVAEDLKERAPAKVADGNKTRPEHDDNDGYADERAWRAEHEPTPSDAIRVVKESMARPRDEKRSALRREYQQLEAQVEDHKKSIVSLEERMSEIKKNLDRKG